MFNIEFKKVRIGSIVALLGAITIFLSVVEVSDLSKLAFSPLNELNISLLLVGIGLASLGVLMMLIDRLPNSLPNIDGSWIYSVRDSEGKPFYHEGDCEIKQSGHRVRIRGIRRIMKWQDTEGDHTNKVSIPWQTNWAWIDDDYTLRYNYHISLTDIGSISGFCRVYIPKENKQPKKMEGHYSMLPPFDENAPNTKWGTIIFEKIDKKT